ncbi:serine hydrolase domain-containing protein [Rhodoluna limnophila]|uniref:serine hydrolase domain-containing protein n=1 Tax=Rhodoluna limnophila TaxID=232537 RepID=UPI001107133A|nr:serine hydrolase domain-containing protein [Rhodoluna limnophila]
MLITPKFETVAELFFAQGKELEKITDGAFAGGSSMAIYQDGELALDIWQGQAKPGQDWQSNTSSVIFSCTKGLTSIVANQLIERGLLDPEQRVAYYWPEFAALGKSEVPVKWLLQHRAGLSAVRRDLTLDEFLDGHTVVDELAAQEPLWAPGTGYQYHAGTFGHLVGEVVRRITGQTIGQYFAEHIAGPLNADAWIGLPADKLGQVAPLITDGKRASGNPLPGTPNYWIEKAMTFGSAFTAEVAGEGTGFNDPRVLQSEFAGAGGVASAKALAKIYSACVTETDGVRLLSDETLREASTITVTGPTVWGEPGPWPNRGLGFMLDTPGFRDMISPTSFGHDGLGGQIAFGDFGYRVGVAYTSSYIHSGPEEQDWQQAAIREVKRILAQ